MSDCTRRNFLKSSLLATTPLLSALSSECRAVESPTAVRWDREADVVVLGFGNAGSNAAIAACDNGASVVILEKMREGGGNVAVSSGGFVVPTDRDKYFVYLKSLYEMSRSDWDEALLNVFCDESMKLPDYIKMLDPSAELVTYGHAGYQNLPGADCVNKMAVTAKNGLAEGDRLFGLFADAVKARGIPVFTETPARRLVTVKGEIVGAEAEHAGKPFFVRARKAVVIATGGFQCNPNLLKNYIYGNPMAFLGSPGHTGDGLLMAQSVGCALWHMNSVSAPLGIQVPGVEAGMALVTKAPAFIWVDQDGRRFVNEKKLDYHCSWMAVNRFDAINHRYPAIPCWMVTDSTYIEAGPLVSSAASGYAVNREHYVWSQDNRKEIEAGVILEAPTLEALARKMGLPEPAVLGETVDRWNSDLKTKGIDTLFGRTPTSDPKQKAIFVGRDVKAWSAPIEKGPFYAVRLVPVLYHTMGGPRKSIRAECLGIDGKPIPHLYVAGELGSMWGLTYQGACANADAMIFGRIAGREAAKLD